MTAPEHRITLRPSGHTYTARADQSLLDAGLAAGLSLPYSCRMGTCNVCKAHIAEGAFEFGAAHPAYLSQAERDQRLALLCQARACGDVVIDVKELPKLVAPQRTRAMVRALRPLAPDVIELHLRLPLHHSMIFAAGQYLDIFLPDGQRRSYSIASASAAPMGTIDLLLQISHMPGGRFTDRLFGGGLKVRELLDIEGPLGTFFLREDSAKPIVMIANGTGYAPLRAMLLEMFRKGIERPVRLYWGGRQRADLYALEEAAAWAQAHPHFTFVPLLSRAGPADGWTGRQGRVQHAVLEDLPDLSGHQVYACGLPAMVADARTLLVARGGLPADEYYADAFVSAADGGHGGATPGGTAGIPIT